MKPYITWLQIGLFVLLLTATGCQSKSWHNAHELTMPMSVGMNFSLVSDESITVVGIEDYEKCYVRAFVLVWAPTLTEAKKLAKEELKLALVRDGENFTVAIDKPDDWNPKKNRLSIRYAVMLPHNTNINIISTHGDVEVINMYADFWVEAQRGEGFCMGCGSRGSIIGNATIPAGKHP
jgi:hypothetical protein